MFLIILSEIISSCHSRRYNGKNTELEVGSWLVGFHSCLLTPTHSGPQFPYLWKKETGSGNFLSFFHILGCKESLSSHLISQSWSKISFPSVSPFLCFSSSLARLWFWIKEQSTLKVLKFQNHLFTRKDLCHWISNNDRSGFKKHSLHYNLFPKGSKRQTSPSKTYIVGKGGAELSSVENICQNIWLIARSPLLESFLNNNNV